MVAVNGNRWLDYEDRNVVLGFFVILFACIVVACVIGFAIGLGFHVATWAASGHW